MTEIRKAFEIRSTLRKLHGEIVMLNQNYITNSSIMTVML